MSATSNSRREHRDNKLFSQKDKTPRYRFNPYFRQPQPVRGLLNGLYPTNGSGLQTTTKDSRNNGFDTFVYLYND